MKSIRSFGMAALGALGWLAGCSEPTPPSEKRLVFVVQPSGTFVLDPIAPPVQVAIQVGSSTVTTARDNITVALAANPGGGTLSGNLFVGAANGIATFDPLTIDLPATGYTITASAPGFPPVTSTSFAIVAQPPFAVTAIAAGHGHTCGLPIGGHLYCWGSGSFGQLGDGSSGDGHQRWRPADVTGGLTFVAVSASTGGLHTCGLTPAGAAYCWGWNYAGQLGDSTTTNRPTPTRVAGGQTFAALGTGAAHTCGITAAGAAYCWGSNSRGQLGDSTNIDRPTPVAVKGGLAFAAISAGGYHSCGLTAVGDLLCWGENVAGAVGDSTTTDRWAPVPVFGGLTFARMSLGDTYTCAVTTADLGYCWGSNTYGQLGDGTTTGRLSPVPVADYLPLATVSAGYGVPWAHTCGLTPLGAAYCWGWNAFGQLGDGTTVDRHKPTAVLGGLTFEEIDAGGFHTCARTKGGNVAYCWGGNNVGAVGDGTTAHRSSPVRVFPP